MLCYIGDHIAHVKYTVLLLPSGTVKICGLDRPAGFTTPKDDLPAELAALLEVDEATAAAEKRKAKKKAARKKKAGAGGGEGGKDDEEEATA